MQIGGRANIIHAFTTDSEVVMYEDHRTIINVLFHLFQKTKFTEPLDIVLFDNHDDFCEPRETTIQKIHTFLQNPSKEDLSLIVEFELNSLDDDWVKAGMELGLVGNVFLFNSDESSVSYREEYITQNFGTKYLYNIGDVWSALGYHGKLNDISKTQYQSLWDDLGWELRDGKFDFRETRRKFVFDIDLDCFSTMILDKTIAIPEEVIVPKLTKHYSAQNHYYYTVIDFMKRQIKDSELVTICFESGCCGGIRQSQKIFNMVDDMLFDSELGE